MESDIIYIAILSAMTTLNDFSLGATDWSKNEITTVLTNLAFHSYNDELLSALPQ